MTTPRFPTFRAVLTLLLVLFVSIGADGATTSSSSRSSTTSSSRSNSSSSGGNSSSSSSLTSTGARQYRSNTLLGDALIQVDAETRSLIVVTDDETHAAIAKVIDSLDHVKPQVLIKVVFIEVTLDKDLDVGIEGSFNFSGGTSGTGGTLFGMASAIASGSYGGFGTLTSNNWAATLHMLSSSGKAQVLSRPSIMARNNQQAVIVVGQEVPMVTNSQISDTGTIVNTIKYQDVGIILRVTPFITSDKTVEMIVAPEISALSDQTVQISSSASAPVINKRSAETVVVTPNATTVVIGGLMQKNVTSTIKKIPILGDIPILGIPFRHTVKSDTRSELLIFLTPYIVENKQKLTNLTLNEANRAEIVRENVSPEDIKNSLDTLRLMPQTDPNCKTQTEVIENATPLPSKR
jgi:general secretion pathway protein D